MLNECISFAIFITELRNLEPNTIVNVIFHNDLLKAENTVVITLLRIPVIKANNTDSLVNLIIKTLGVIRFSPLINI